MFRYRCIHVLRNVRDTVERCCSTTYALKNPTSSGQVHIPVMKNEVIEYLGVKDGDTVLDMTFGAGGHSRGLLEKYPNLKIIALDRDPAANEHAINLQNEKPDQVIPLLGRFSELHELLGKNNIPFGSVDGVICDLGASSMQMDTAERGFALSKLGPLDMRMDGDRYPDSITAADVVNYASEDNLTKIFKIYGEEGHARKIARSIVHARITYQKFNTTADIADLVDLVCKGRRLDKLARRAHSATKVFQALRIFVNNEINELNQGLIIANFYLKQHGRIVVLSFHSLEDRLAKSHFQGHIFGNCQSPTSHMDVNPAVYAQEKLDRYLMKAWHQINKKVIVPQKNEVECNPRSRSAKLRAAEKINPIQ